ncbi:DsbA family protein [Natrialbaceae archaeon GCM10025810]|uniref:DsbA family protein n=1 Tax=Halovalidus salilacus TaxID=3075124 RepID=UPI0036070811
MILPRREFVGAAAAALVGLAGCLGDGGDGDGSGDEIDLEAGDGESSFAPTLGDSDADVTVTVFSDYACPHCQRFEESVFPEIVSNYVDPGDVAYQHRDFVVPVHETWSWAIAGAGRSVHEQADDEAFFEFFTAIFDRSDDYSDDAIESVASDLEADVDAEQVRTDAEDGTYREEIEASREAAADAGVEGTPTVVVDGQPVELQSSEDYESVEEAIESALE